MNIKVSIQVKDRGLRKKNTQRFMFGSGDNVEKIMGDEDLGAMERKMHLLV